jgi:hypothetical protein
LVEKAWASPARILPHFPGRTVLVEEAISVWKGCRNQLSSGIIWSRGKRVNESWGWSLMIFRARATRGLRRPSPGLMARLDVPVGGRVKKPRAMEDQSAPIPEERTSKLGGTISGLDGWTMQPQSIQILHEPPFMSQICLSAHPH